ncbi:hypothetical protein [Romboutsia ilealis]|uniref:hypothetical protein n=1 Tax=Romboutsia ilealis TaxID=1115758 RepID=UPI00272C7DDF|nr:hypothetical protein [Romboutsia ilealis]
MVKYDIIWSESCRGVKKSLVKAKKDFLSAIASVSHLINTQSQSYKIEYIYIVKVTDKGEELIPYNKIKELIDTINSLTSCEDIDNIIKKEEDINNGSN